VKFELLCRNVIILLGNYPSASCQIELLVTTWVMLFSYGGKDSSQTGNISHNWTRWLVVHIMISCSILYFLLWLLTTLVMSLTSLIHRPTGILMDWSVINTIVIHLVLHHVLSDVTQVFKMPSPIEIIETCMGSCSLCSVMFTPFLDLACQRRVFLFLLQNKYYLHTPLKANSCLSSQTPCLLCDQNLHYCIHKTHYWPISWGTWM